MVDERQQGVNPKPCLKFGVAPSFSEWAVIRVASKSMITGSARGTGER
jgi:hypothetical protein